METCRGIMGYRPISLAWMLVLVLAMLGPDKGTRAQCSTNDAIVCQNGGQCGDTPAGPECRCLDGFSGDLCQVVGDDVDDCQTPTTHACQNNALCQDGVGTYTCQCLSGWEGTFCQKEKDECQSEPCQNGGNCTDEFDGFTCECPPTFTGPTCGADVDECLAQGEEGKTPLCQNGAVCKNLIGGFVCDCQEGFAGDLCETEIDECAVSPCYFGGVCVDLINNFRCECLEGFAGPQCQGVVQECQLADVCGDNGICIGKPLGGYECFCKPGYYGDHCQTQVNLCSANPCRNRAPCINYGTSYTCTCLAGYKGENCETDIDECASQPCANNGTCTEPSPGDFSCQCLSGFMGQTCDVDVDECGDSPCPAFQECQDLVNGFSCHCPPGKAGGACDIDVYDCRVSPCQNGGACAQADDDTKAYTCTCPSPFTDESCSSSLDPCIPDPCVHSGRCNNRVDNGTGEGVGYWCDCLEGYVGVRCEGDVYDCLDTPCSNNGTCRDLPYNLQDAQSQDRLKFECLCGEGFTGRLCQTEIDACWDSLCQNEANCTVQGIEDYTCDCSPEWTGKHCDSNVNECLAIPPVCLHNGQCLDLTPGFRCVCPPPWTGSVCQERIVYCVNNDTCQHGGTCVEGQGEEEEELFTCQCLDAYTGPDCSRQVSPCLPNPCLRNSTCRVGQTTNSNNNSANTTNTTTTTSPDGDGMSSFVCDCLPGYNGKLCDGNIDECTVLKPCQNNGICRDGIDSFTCDCVSGWTGPVCDVAVNGCVPDPCLNGGLCQEDDLDDGGGGGGGGLYKCLCLPGYTGAQCQDEIKNCEAGPCQNEAACLEENGGFRCLCVPGFAGDFCETNVDDCDPSPCHGSASCQDLVDDFVCDCPQGFTGRTCSDLVKPCVPSPCRFGGVCNTGVEDGGGFTCTCPAGVEGDRCQTIVTASFDGDSVMELTSVISLVESLDSDDGGEDLAGSNRRRRSGGGGGRFSNTLQYVKQGMDGAQLFPLHHDDDDDGDDWEQQTYNHNHYHRGRNGFGRRRRKRQADDGGGSGGGGSINNQGNILVSFTFTTTVVDGVLLLTDGTSPEGRPQHAVIELQSPNLLYVSLNNGHQTLTELLPLDSSTLDVHSHAVELALANSFTSSIKVTSSVCSSSVGGSGEACPSATLTFENRTEWKLDGSFQLGGVDEFTPYTRSVVSTGTGFTGCLGNLAVNGKPVNLGESPQFSESDKPSTSSSSSTSSTTFPSSGPEPGCPTHSPCLPDLCLNGAKCIDLWLSKECRCLVGFKGHRCEIQNTAHFEADSMLYVGSFDRISDISFWITGTQTSGLLMYTLAGDGLSLSLDNSSIRMALVFQTSGGDEDGMVIRVGDGLHLDQWLRIHLTFDNNAYTLQVSTEESGLVSSSQGTSVRAIRVSGPVFVGRLHPHPALDLWRRGDNQLPSQQSLNGCIRDVSINGQPINFLDTSPSSLGNDPPTPRPGCARDESCLSLTCSNEGVCLPGWEGPTCVCDDNFHGPTCTNATAYTFDGTHSYSFLQVDRTRVAFGDLGTVEFRTRQNTSTLMWIQVYGLDGQATEVIELRIFNGFLQIFSSFTQATAQSNVRVSDGVWHSLTWTRDKDDLTLTLDHSGDTFGIRASFDPYGTDLNHTVHVYVGARPLTYDTSSHIVGFFQGCIRNVTFNSDLINLASFGEATSQPGVTSKPTSITSGCQNVSICSINPCPANSYCKDEWNHFSCPCLPGWEGPDCDRSTDDCRLNVCQNSAKCVDHHLSYTCECPPQYMGRLCQTVFEPCREQVCSVENTLSCVSYNYSYFVCECEPGYTGETCEALIDNCVPSPCLNEAVCENSVNNYTCQCQDGFLGRNCHIKDYCVPKPCYNDGLCSLLALDTSTQGQTNTNTHFESSTSTSPSSSPSSTPNSLPIRCQCKRPYFGSQCQEYDYCHQHLCKNEAACVLKPDRYTCDCPEGYYGTYCEFQDHCFQTPCLNDGQCRNSVDSYTCVCPFYFTGTNCEIPVNQCLKNICLNGATCVFNDSLTSSANSPNADIDTYECVCVEGFNGTNCEVDINECESNPCENNATCVESNSLTRSSFFPGYRCDCVVGFTGQRCQEDVDDCQVNPCQNEGRCEDRVDGYHCVCPPGFVNPDCSVDQRGCGSNPCLNGAGCQDGEEGGGSYTCLCLSGFEGVLCGKNKDDCLQHECINGGVCVDGVDDYTCQCLDGYAGPRCKEIVDACYTQPCHHGGVCSYRGVCSCVDVVIACGWHDEDCQRTRCLQRPDCGLESPAYTCDCTGTGYTGTQCTVDADECNPPPPSPSSPCGHGGVCINTVGGFDCDCDQTGYQGDRCLEDTNECGQPDNPCFNGGLCINAVGGFQCECLPAWTGAVCGQLKDHCEGGPCLNGGVCTSGMEGFTCDCLGTGFDGDTCVRDIDDCVNNRCQNGGVCQDGVRRYTCVCDGTGYTGQFCQTPSSSCASLSCLHNGTCVLVAGGGSGGDGSGGGGSNPMVTCLCLDTGFHGHRCQYDDDECQDGNHLCPAGRGQCVNTPGAYTCQCLDGYTGDACETALFQEDASSSGVSDGVIAVCVLLVMFLVVMAALYALWQWKRRRKTQGRYKPSQVEGGVMVVGAGGMPLDKLASRDERLI